jgi:hypothetical protein
VIVRVIQAILVFALFGGWAASGRAADLVVIASDDPSVALGTKIDGGKPIAIAAGASLVLVSSTGRTIKLAGPYSGMPDPSAAGGDDGLVDSLSQLIKEEGGSSTTLAVFRGGLDKTPIGRPDIWGVDIAREGSYCLRPDRPAMLWWYAARPGAVVKLSDDEDGSGGARIRWPQSKKYTPWPDTLALSDGATYVARFRSGDTGTPLKAVLMPALDTDAHRAAWMAGHGCTQQALRVLDAMGQDEL